MSINTIDYVVYCHKVGLKYYVCDDVREEFGDLFH
jgi:hypothetical protein